MLQCAHLRFYTFSRPGNSACVQGLLGTKTIKGGKKSRIAFVVLLQKQFQKKVFTSRINAFLFMHIYNFYYNYYFEHVFDLIFYEFDWSKMIEIDKV